MGFQKIFVALDGSQLGDLVFHQSLDLAQSNQAELMLFHCLPVSLGDAILPMPVELGMYPELVQETYDSQQHRHNDQQATAIAFLEKYQDQALQANVKVSYQCAEGEAASHICQVAKIWGADVIIVGRRGMAALAEILLGSISNHVMHHAHCSVLVIHN